MRFLTGLAARLMMRRGFSCARGSAAPFLARNIPGVASRPPVVCCRSLDSFAFLAFSRIMRGAAVWSELLGMKSRVIVSGCLGVASFCVFLWALSRNSVGAVSAVRETSVLFAMVIGAVIYNEPMSLARLAGGSLVVAGIVTIAMWR
jgi:drug/metabolite transporter (DMT)-like permease